MCLAFACLMTTRLGTFAAWFRGLQVATRFLSSSPAMYWFAAHLLTASNKQSNSWVHRGVWMWCWTYTLVGTVLFVNFYPWT